MDDCGELLLVMLDTSLLQPNTPSYIEPSLLLRQLILFLRAHQLLSDNNHQSVMALTPSSSPILVTPDSCRGNTAALPTLLLERLAHVMDTSGAMQQQAQQQHQPQQQQQQHPQLQQQQQEVALSAGLSRALCYVQRFTGRYGATARHRAKPRLLALMASADMPLQYIPVMNAIFAAQGAGVVLDSVVLGAADSPFLQQATHLTGGMYMRVGEPSCLLQYLLGAFSANTATRECLSISSSSQVVDYRASCFCHKQIIDTGYICSVCLSIFCKANMRASACLTCGAPFKNKAQQQQARAAAAAAGGGAAAAAAAGGGGGD